MQVKKSKRKKLFVHLRPKDESSTGNEILLLGCDKIGNELIEMKVFVCENASMCECV